MEENRTESSHVKGPEVHTFAVNAAKALWNEMMDYQDESQMGYPGWQLDRVTIATWNMADVSVKS